MWSEIYDEIGPALERVLATGEASWCEDKMLFINRDGYAEEVRFSFHTILATHALRPIGRTGLFIFFPLTSLT